MLAAHPTPAVRRGLAAFFLGVVAASLPGARVTAQPIFRGSVTGEASGESLEVGASTFGQAIIEQAIEFNSSSAELGGNIGGVGVVLVQDAGTFWSVDARQDGGPAGARPRDKTRG
ncbi:MAG: hypothetical protein AAGJ46_18775, partial [Planctomycetota bacterium]